MPPPTLTRTHQSTQLVSADQKAPKTPPLHLVSMGLSKNIDHFPHMSDVEFLFRDGEILPKFCRVFCRPHEDSFKITLINEVRRSRLFARLTLIYLRVLLAALVCIQYSQNKVRTQKTITAKNG